MENQNIEYFATQIVDAAIKVHRSLGPGLLESAYQKCLAIELRKRELLVECELIVLSLTMGLPLKSGTNHMRWKKLIIENKTVEKILPSMKPNFNLLENERLPNWVYIKLEYEKNGRGYKTKSKYKRIRKICVAALPFKSE